MGRQVSSFGTDSVTNRTVTTSQNVLAGERIFANATTASFTLTLPSSPSDGDTVQIIDVTGIFCNKSCYRCKKRIKNSKSRRRFNFEPQQRSSDLDIFRRNIWLGIHWTINGNKNGKTI